MAKTKAKPKAPRVVQRITVEVVERPDGTQQVRNRCAVGTSPFAAPAILRAALVLAERNVTLEQPIGGDDGAGLAPVELGG